MEDLNDFWSGKYETYEMMQNFCDANSDVVIGTWRHWFKFENAIHVYLKCNDHVVARRMRKRLGQESIDLELMTISKHNESIHNTIQNRNNINTYDIRNYDIIIDTSDMSVEEVAYAIQVGVDLQKHRKGE